MNIVVVRISPCAMILYRFLLFLIISKQASSAINALVLSFSSSSMQSLYFCSRGCIFSSLSLVTAIRASVVPLIAESTVICACSFCMIDATIFIAAAEPTDVPPNLSVLRICV